MPRSTLIQVRRDTASNWTSTNPTLAAGEVGFESDTFRMKIGTGSNDWAGLTYIRPASSLALAGITGIEGVFEKATVVAAEPVAVNGGTLSLNISSGAVYYYTTSTTKNVVLDITTTGLAENQAATVMVVITSGSAAGKLSAIKLNSGSALVAPALKWFGGNHFPDGSSSGAADAYTITVFRSSTGYTAFASQSKFA